MCIIYTCGTNTNEKKKKKSILSQSNMSEEIKRIQRVIITAGCNQRDTYFQEWWASSCGASF